MKRLLALILILIICFMFIVACNKDNGFSPVVMTEDKVDYYPNYSYELDSVKESQVAIADDEKALIQSLAELGIDAEASLKSLPVEIFENCYVLVVVNKHVNTLQGYRSVTKTKNGYLIIADRYFLYEGYTISGDGKRVYELGIDVGNEDALTQRSNTCDVIMIPKSEFDSPPTAENIQLHNVIYNFTN